MRGATKTTSDIRDVHRIFLRLLRLVGVVRGDLAVEHGRTLLSVGETHDGGCGRRRVAGLLIMETNWWLPIGYDRSESTPFRRLSCAGDRDFAHVVASAYILDNIEQMTSLCENNVYKALIRQNHTFAVVTQ